MGVVNTLGHWILQNHVSIDDLYKKRGSNNLQKYRSKSTGNVLIISLTQFVESLEDKV